MKLKIKEVKGVELVELKGNVMGGPDASWHDPMRSRYDLETGAWIEANIRPTGRAADAPIGAPRTATDRGYWETYKVREQALQEELKRKQLSGDLVEVDLVARQSERRITHAKALLAQVPDRVLGLLPKEVKPATRKQLRGRLAEMIDDVLFALAEAAEEEVTTDGEDSDSGD